MDIREQVMAALAERDAPLQQHIEELNLRMQHLEQNSVREPGDGGSAKSGMFAVTATGERIPLLTRSDRMRDHFKADGGEEFSLAQFARDGIMGGTKAASGPALVPVSLSTAIIDDVRAATAIVRAGAMTMPIDGPTKLARIEQDPTIYQHSEGAEDIDESDVELVPVELNPRMLATIIPLTEELVADSPNLDMVLSRSLTAAFALKLDALALATILADAAIPTSTPGYDPATWSECMMAIGEAMALNQPLPLSMVTNSSDMIFRASEVGTANGNWLGKPPILSGMTEYPTTSIASGTAVYGGFDHGFLFALRSMLRVEIVRWHEPKKAKHALVAHMRAAGFVMQPKALFIQNGASST